MSASLEGNNDKHRLTQLLQELGYSVEVELDEEAMRFELLGRNYAIYGRDPDDYYFVEYSEFHHSYHYDEPPEWVETELGLCDTLSGAVGIVLSHLATSVADVIWGYGEPSEDYVIDPICVASNGLEDFVVVGGHLRMEAGMRFLPNPSVSVEYRWTVEPADLYAQIARQIEELGMSAEVSENGVHIQYQGLKFQIFPPSNFPGEDVYAIGVRVPEVNEEGYVVDSELTVGFTNDPESTVSMIVEYVGKRAAWREVFGEMAP